MTAIRYVVKTRDKKSYLVEDVKTFWGNKWILYLGKNKLHINLLIPYQGPAYIWFSKKWLKVHKGFPQADNYIKTSVFHVKEEHFMDRFIVASNNKKPSKAKFKFLSGRIASMTRLE